MDSRLKSTLRKAAYLLIILGWAWFVALACFYLGYFAGSLLP